MRPIIAPRSAGFTLVETMVALSIIGITLAFGLPQIFDWVRASKVQSAVEFYAEGFRTAHDEAVKHKASSRITLTTNTTNNQLDWQVDLCFPSPTVVCDDTNANWSTRTVTATGDPEGTVNGFKSQFRSAGTMLPTTTLRATIYPLGANQVYFTSLGWTNTVIPDNITLLVLDSPAGVPAFQKNAISVTLGGVTSKCFPDVALHDSRKCPP